MSAILSAPPEKEPRVHGRTAGRPSLLDPVLAGDPWMGTCSQPGLLVLDLRNYPIALQPGTRLDQASFNSWIYRLRNSAPRNGGVRE